MNKIICIQGLKNSGKDSAADMLQYLMNKPSWMHNYWMYKYKFSNSYNWKIVHYADKLKEVVAILLNVTVDDLNDRNFKEQCYVDFTTLELFWKEEITNSDKILTDTKFNKEIKRLDMNLTRNYYLSVRQVLQFIGTEVLRHFLGNELWILHTLKNNTNIIVADQRFLVENQAAQDHDAFIIHITRPNSEQGLHTSESELQTLLEQNKYNYHLENDGSLKDLFNKCVKMVKVLKSNNPKKLTKYYK